MDQWVESMDAIERAATEGIRLPLVIAHGPDQAQRAFLEFFAARIRNPNTRAAYHRAARQFFSWCFTNGLNLKVVRPVHVAAYIEQLGAHKKPQTVKQTLAAIRSLFDWFVVSQVIPSNPSNPATPVRGPRYSVSVGKTPVLTSGEMRKLLVSIGTEAQIDLRDRALIGLMYFTFSRVGAAVGVDIGDLFVQEGHTWVRLREKGGRDHAMPLHPDLDAMIRAYLSRVPTSKPDTPLFRAAINRIGILGDTRLDRRDAWEMVQRRAVVAGLNSHATCHSFRATGITSYLSNGGTLDDACSMAAHASTKTTSMYDRRRKASCQGEIQKISSLA